ncbi:MAG TPA: deoxyribodipyrimidine photo-lyase [Thermoanaerobaculia bacterium]|nr:deoxyribodipyrimidine photo-lyase [Thermoanaerobaculia bacterium]
MSLPPSRIPEIRRRTLVDRPLRPDGEVVVYWMTATRRLGWNFALERAAELAAATARPLLVLEALRCGYRWASDRHHAFVLAGMAEHAERAARAGIGYHPYVEAAPGEGSGLVRELSRRAVAVVADDSPVFFLPRMLAAAARQVECRLEAVDSHGLLPLRATPKAFPTAFAFRRFLQGALKAHLSRPPAAEPLGRGGWPRAAELPEAIARRWPRADERLLGAEPGALARLPIDHSVAPVGELPGGSRAAGRRLEQFLDDGFERYAEERNHPDAAAASGLSPWLHFGQISPHEILARLAEREGWVAETLPEGGRGARAGWWGMSANAEAFLDELVTWRELGAAFAVHRPDEQESYDSLPDWALRTLAGHAADPRPELYSADELESAATGDGLWNAAQRQLLGEGRIQNYLRMLWGKRILEWSPDPRAALERMLELNHRWALDGRDPNSASGILWCLGRYDRAWGPERPIFGTVRYMSSANTRRKLRLDRWLERWGGEGQRPLEV